MPLLSCLSDISQKIHIELTVVSLWNSTDSVSLWLLATSYQRLRSYQEGYGFATVHTHDHFIVRPPLGARATSTMIQYHNSHNILSISINAEHSFYAAICISFASNWFATAWIRTQSFPHVYPALFSVLPSRWPVGWILQRINYSVKLIKK